MKRNRFWLWAACAVLAARGRAEIIPTYALGSPDPAPVFYLPDSVETDPWSEANPVFVASAGFVCEKAVSCVNRQVPDAEERLRYALDWSEVGFSWERLKPEYYIGDQLVAPKGVDWNATYKRFNDLQGEDGALAGGFLFNSDPNAPCVYVTEGGSHRFEWVMADGSTNSIVYVLSSVARGRPKRIYWTDYPYNGQKISLQGKFVKFFGASALVDPTTATVTNLVGGMQVEQKDVVVSGLYLDSASMTLEARGRLTGQVVMVYYDDGNYTSILHVQTLEICQPDVIVNSGTLGTAIRPNGRGYDITGLQARVTAGIGNSTDNRGDYFYQHAGQYSYSPKNGDVFPLRPTEGERWKAEVYWMETDPMDVLWPFELDQYNLDWPAEMPRYVRGDLGGDFGADIVITNAYTATLQTYQEPDGHARAVDEQGRFRTVGAGKSLLKIAGEDDVWFMPVQSVLRGDTSVYTLKPSRVNVGAELEPRSGTRSGVVPGVRFSAAADIPGYVYQAGTPGKNYAVGVYSETNTASAVYAVSTNGDIEVWWSERFQKDGMPAAIFVPALPQVYRPVWPEPDEAPQIVIASQKGSANEMTYARHGAAYFDAATACLRLAPRRYFGEGGEGTLMFWTRGAHYNDPDADPGADTPLVSLARGALRIGLVGGRLSAEVAGTGLTCAMPADTRPNVWHHVAVTVKNGAATLYLDGEAAAAADGVDTTPLQGVMTDCVAGAAPGETAASGREIAEIALFSSALPDIPEARYRIYEGTETGLTGYYSFRKGEDLSPVSQQTGEDVRTFRDRAGGGTCAALNMAFVAPGAPAKGGIVLRTEEEPTVYYQNDRALPGYNPNDEHAFVRAGSGGYIVWALRSDLATQDTPPPAVFAAYSENGRNQLQFFHVVATNDTWKALRAGCTAGAPLPGPHPLDLLDTPWLPEDYWDASTDSAGAAVPGPGYRDRKNQLWARAAGELGTRMYYAMREGFWFPQLPAAAQPAVGTPVPWMVRHDRPDADVLRAPPGRWQWDIAWPTNIVTMKIGQTLTVAADDLPEVWNAKSVSVVYPVASADPDQGADVAAGQVPVMLSDPTVTQTADLPEADFLNTGLSTGANGGLSQKSGKYRFTELPPSISGRLFYDIAAQRLCLVGERTEKNAGAAVLYPNVLSSSERAAVLALVKEDAAGRAAWVAAVDGLATAPVLPNTMTVTNGNSEIVTAYRPADHYALTALGPTNYVVIVENDASGDRMAKDEDGKPFACPVADGDAVNMRVFFVTNLYYTGRVVTREDEVNLLSQQLSVLYTDPFGGRPDDFEFEWKSSDPNPDGTVPDDYALGYLARPVATNCGEIAGSAPTVGRGLARFVVGQQGDTLANLVNKYWICRYRAVEGTPAHEVMGDQWSAWCAPPALAEGWVQRVLNNVTPFNQRMTDLYENKAETAVSMIQQAGGPYTGDVALNQDNLATVGLIQLYETLLNKAESISLLLGIDDAGANKQLLLAAERLGDLYKVLGDEAYSDAKNPTIGFGDRFGHKDQIDFSSVASSLFCFDNQVSSLLDEELCLLRGRSGVSAPGTRTAPYYNRLLWNFTKGITAGEVAYAVNYDVSGTETTALSEEQAARIYPQGHGDAYGHYLSALKGWYRLLRNPYFTWGSPAQGEMNVADSAVNVDYYEEAKFAEAAADLARTAADVVDLSALKAWRDNGAGSSGYIDGNTTNAFGYGEWASRGGYGALVNWAVANSLLPEDRALSAVADEGPSAAYTDLGLTRIDRGTVDELADICESADRIQAALDRLDAGLNPLGLSDNAVPFDISPNGATDGSNTHFEQVAERAETALANARKVLDRAQTEADRMRMIAETAENYRNEIASEEEDYDTELIGYFGTPYSDDIGPGKTYEQGYEGPDLVHYMWMDISKYGLSDLKDTQSVETWYYDDLGTYTFNFVKHITALWGSIKDELDDRQSEKRLLICERSASGLLMKPENISGTRRMQGSIQEKYGDYLRAYAEVEKAAFLFEEADGNLNLETKYSTLMADLYFVEFVAKEAASVAQVASEYKSAGLNLALNTVDWMIKQNEVYDGLKAALPDTIGAGMTVVVSPRSVADAATRLAVTPAYLSLYSQQYLIKNLLISDSPVLIELSHIGEQILNGVNYHTELATLLAGIKSKAEAVNEAYFALQEAVARCNASVAAFNSEVAKAEQVLAKREQVRKRQVDQLSQYRYNEMLFRKIRDKSLTRYSAAFDLARKYVYMAAQAYDYETALRSEDETSGDAFRAKIVAARALGAFDEDGRPVVADSGDLGLSGCLAQMKANWLVMKPRLGINNPQPYTTWFSLRGELFRILDGEAGDSAWAKELSKHWSDDILSDPEFRRYCQPFQSQFGVREKEPGLIIPFSTTIDFAKNLFGNELAGGDHAYDSSWYSTRVAAAGVWFDGYNARTPDAPADAKPQLSETPVAYLVPVGADCLRAPGLADGTYWRYSVADQVVAAPYAIGSRELDDDLWMPSMNDADWEGGDATVKIRKHPSFRAYFDASGGTPTDNRLDATRLVGRSVWNTRWILVIPAGAMNADREKALSVFIHGQDSNRDGKTDLSPVSDIKIGFRTYSQSGN